MIRVVAPYCKVKAQHMIPQTMRCHTPPQPHLHTLNTPPLCNHYLDWPQLEISFTQSAGQYWPNRGQCQVYVITLYG